MLAASIGFTLLIGIRHLLPGEAASGGSFDAFCPFGAIETLWRYITTGTALRTTSLLNFTILGGVLAVSIISGRAFCGWMCPVGAVQEFLAWLARRVSGEKHHIRGKRRNHTFPIHLTSRGDRVLVWAKYLILALIVWASAATVYPPLHAFCPARALFSFKLTTGLMWSVLITFIVTSLFVERVWCKYLCPLGAFLSVFNKLAPLRLVVNDTRCNACGRCEVDCPMGIRNIPDRLRDCECIQCLECMNTCAREGALELKIF